MLIDWQASTIHGARFTIQTILKILSGLEFDRAMIKVIKAGLATVTMITVGDYCSVTPGVLHRPLFNHHGHLIFHDIQGLLIPITTEFHTTIMKNSKRN